MKNSDLKILQEKYDDILNEAGWFTRQKARLASLNPFDKENLKNIGKSVGGKVVGAIEKGVEKIAPDKLDKFYSGRPKLAKKVAELAAGVGEGSSGLRSKRVISLLNTHWKDVHKLLHQIKEDLKSVNIGLDKPERIDDVFNEDEISRDLIELILNKINSIKSSSKKGHGLFKQHKPMMPPK